MLMIMSLVVGTLCLILSRSLFHGLRQRRVEQAQLGIGLTGGFWWGCQLWWWHDQAIASGFLPASRGELLNFGLFALFVSQAWFVLTKFAGPLNRLERLTTSLDRRGKKREEELTTLLEQRVKDSVARALTKERNRLMQDVHDGVGRRSLVIQNSGSEGAQPLIQKNIQRTQ